MNARGLRRSAARLPIAAPFSFTYPTPMVIRIVRMIFRPDEVETFLSIFDRSASQIRAFPGCSRLELWQDARFPNILTTCSHWSDPEALEHYRQSELFRHTWAQAKRLFAGPPEAFSHTVVRPAGSVASA